MKKIGIISLLFIAVGGGIGYWFYNKPHQNIGLAQADFVMEAVDLFQQFEMNESAANEQFLGKIIEVFGKVQSVSKNEEDEVIVILNAGGLLGGVSCTLDNLSKHDRTSFQKGEMVHFKGICTGVLVDVVLIRCIEMKVF